MLGNIGNLHASFILEVTKRHLYHLFEVSNYYVMYWQRPSQFCEMSAMVKHCVLSDGSVSFCEIFVVTDREV